MLFIITLIARVCVKVDSAVYCFTLIARLCVKTDSVVYFYADRSVMCED